MNVFSRNERLLVVKDWDVLHWFFLVSCFVMIIFGDIFYVLIAAPVSLYLVFSVQITTIIIDKNIQKIFITKKKIFSTNNESYDFSEISEIVLSKAKYINGIGYYSLSWGFVLASGVFINFSKRISVFFYFYLKNKILETSREVATFIGVPFVNFNK